MLQHKGTCVLVTERLVLRPFSPDDARDMYDNWATDERVLRQVSWNAHPSAEFTRERLTVRCANYEKPDYYDWVIVLDGHAIGNVSADISDKHESAELGYCLSFAHWNRGMMTEAVAAVRDYLFREVGLHRLVIRHDVRNPASGRVARKIGCTWEGCQRGAVRDKNGGFADVDCLALLRNEWEELGQTFAI